MNIMIIMMISIQHRRRYTWDANSMQNAALYIVMNLVLTPITRSYLRNEHVARQISVSARYSSSPTPISTHFQSSTNTDSNGI